MARCCCSRSGQLPTVMHAASMLSRFTEGPVRPLHHALLMVLRHLHTQKVANSRHVSQHLVSERHDSALSVEQTAHLCIICNAGPARRALLTMLAPNPGSAAVYSCACSVILAAHAPAWARCHEPSSLSSGALLAADFHCHDGRSPLAEAELKLMLDAMAHVAINPLRLNSVKPTVRGLRHIKIRRESSPPSAVLLACRTVLSAWPWHGQGQCRGQDHGQGRSQATMRVLACFDCPTPSSAAPGRRN